MERPQRPEEEGWARHPYTRDCLRALERRRDASLADLLRSCVASPDPMVRTAHERYRSLQEFTEFFAVRKETEDYE